MIFMVKKCVFSIEMPMDLTENNKLNTDKYKENTIAPEKSAAQDTPGLFENKPETVSEDKKRRTVGNRVYDWLIYSSIAWGGVALLSAMSAHEAQHGKNPLFNWLRLLNKNVYNGLRNTLSKTILKGASEERIHGYAQGTTLFVTLGMGGNALAAPIKWLEDNRQKNAARIDRLLGTTPPHPETIAAEVPQTWHSVITGRLLSWGTSYLVFLGMGPKITGQVSGWFGKKFTHGWMSLRPKSNLAGVRRWMDIAAFDATFTVITATLTYLFSRYVAKKDQKKHEVEEKLERAAHPESAPSTNTTATAEKEPDSNDKPFAEKYASTNKRGGAPAELHTQKLALSENSTVPSLG